MNQIIKSALLLTIAAAPAFTQPASAKPLPYSRISHISLRSDSLSVQSVYTEKKETVRFFIANPTGKYLRCTFKGPDGTTLESFAVRTGKKPNFTRDYVFTSAEEGLYTLEVSNGADKVVKKIDFQRVTPEASAKFTVR